MMNRKLNVLAATLVVGALFAGCSDRETRVENAPGAPLPPTSTTSSESVTPAPASRAAGESAAVAPPSASDTPSSTTGTTYGSGIATSSATAGGMPSATATTGSDTAAVNADSKELQDLKQEIVLLRSRVAELERTKDRTAVDSSTVSGVPAGKSAATSGVGGTSDTGAGGVTASTRSGLDSATTAGVSGGTEVRLLKQELETLRQRVEKLEHGRGGSGGGSLSGMR